MKQIFYCCKNKPESLITYSVAGTEKTYSVCKHCAELDCFSKHVIRKEIIGS